MPCSPHSIARTLPESEFLNQSATTLPLSAGSTSSCRSKTWPSSPPSPTSSHKDGQYLADGRPYLTAGYDDPPYVRIETILLKAFPDMPHHAAPWAAQGYSADRIYELRSYEGPTEQYFANKVQMFNEGGEITLFEKLGFHAVFYASVLSGAHMPNLMYMTSFENMAARDDHWKTFGADPTWKSLSSSPQYQHNVSHIDDYFPARSALFGIVNTIHSHPHILFTAPSSFTENRSVINQILKINHCSEINHPPKNSPYEKRRSTIHRHHYRHDSRSVRRYRPELTGRPTHRLTGKIRLRKSKRGKESKTRLTGESKQM